jgi:hypothetical protein
MVSTRAIVDAYSNVRREAARNAPKDGKAMADLCTTPQF